MEDYNSNLLNDSKNEWSIRLMNIISSHIIDGFRAIFNEAIELCDNNDEPEKYLMTYQNFLRRIPNWNQSIIETETNRICEASKCEYLEDLITCVHITQLKILSCVRTNNQNTKIDINIPDLKSFLHRVYINIARKLYSNIYLFQVDVSPLEQQKNNREFEVIVQTCIMNTIRDNIPIDELLRQYIDETQEVDVYTKEKIVKHDVVEEEEPVVNEQNDSPTVETPQETENKNNTPSTETTPEIKEQNEIVSQDSVLPNNISFDDVVEKYDPVNDEKTTENINFEPKDEPEISGDSGYDDDQELNDKPITIGESVSLNIDEEHNDINLGVEEINSDIINLGVEEISV